MAGMFYSIKEVSEKLGKSEDEVRQIVKSGRLREFRDGPNLLFKVDEVNSLLSDTSFMAVNKPPDTAAAAKSEEAEADEMLLAPETTGPAEKADEELQLTDADTQIVDDGIKVLGDTDASGKGGSDETFKGLDETPSSPGKEASLEEIEKDASLDTFGSGSGLLDLSLQADDTSLGGILDEIYTPGGEGKAAPAAGEPAADKVGAEGSAMEVAAEADQMLSAEQFPETPVASPAAAAAIGYVEAAPDAMSNALGVMLFIPLLAVIYTIIAAISALSSVTPDIVKMSQSFIWYIAIGMAAASLFIAIVGAAMGREKKPKVPKPPKPPKVKKEKPPKPVKEKKGK
jgi:hypothetical protein